jgi:hypothetical protein
MKMDETLKRETSELVKQVTVLKNHLGEDGNYTIARIDRANLELWEIVVLGDLMEKIDLALDRCGFLTEGETVTELLDAAEALANVMGAHKWDAQGTDIPGYTPSINAKQPEGLRYLFCDDWLIFAANDNGYIYTVNTEMWPVWLDQPEGASEEPYALERYILPFAMTHWDKLDWTATVFSNGHLHLKDLKRPNMRAAYYESHDFDERVELIAGITYRIRSHGLITEDRKEEVIKALVAYFKDADSGITYETHDKNQPVEELVVELLDAAKEAQDAELGIDPELGW